MEQLAGVVCALVKIIILLWILNFSTNLKSSSTNAFMNQNNVDYIQANHCYVSDIDRCNKIIDIVTNRCDAA